MSARGQREIDKCGSAVCSPEAVAMGREHMCGSFYRKMAHKALVYRAMAVLWPQFFRTARRTDSSKVLVTGHRGNRQHLGNTHASHCVD